MVEPVTAGAAAAASAGTAAASGGGFLSSLLSPQGLLAASTGIDALGGLFGGIFGGDSGARQIKETPGAGIDVNADPVLAALRFENLLRLGRFDPSVGEQGSPVGRLVNELSGDAVGDLRRKDIERISIALAGVPGRPGLVQSIANVAEKLGPDATVQEIADKVEANFRTRFSGGSEARVLQQLLGRAGVTLNELIQQEIDFQRDFEAQSARFQEVADAALSGRMSAIEAISALQQDLPGVGQTDIDNLQALFEERLTGNLERDVGDIRDELLQTANVGRFNPAGSLGRLAEAELFERGDIPLTAIESALALLEGQQGLASQAFTNLGLSLGDANTAALATTPAQTGLIDLINGARSQASALAGLPVSTNQTGLGVASGLQSLGRGLGNIGIINLAQQVHQDRLRSLGGPASDVRRSDPAGIFG